MKTIWDEKRLLVLVILLVLCCACTPRFTKPNTEEALKERVDLLWKAKVKGDWETVFNMTDTRFKKMAARDRYIKKANLIVKNFTILNVDVNENGKQGSSIVIFETIMMGHSLKARVKELWVFEDGAWHLNRSDRRTPFDKMKK